MVHNTGAHQPLHPARCCRTCDQVEEVCAEYDTDDDGSLDAEEARTLVWDIWRCVVASRDAATWNPRAREATLADGARSRATTRANSMAAMSRASSVRSRVVSHTGPDKAMVAAAARELLMRTPTMRASIPGRPPARPVVQATSARNNSNLAEAAPGRSNSNVTDAAPVVAPWGGAFDGSSARSRPGGVSLPGVGVEASGDGISGWGPDQMLQRVSFAANAHARIKVGVPSRMLAKQRPSAAAHTPACGGCRSWWLPHRVASCEFQIGAQPMCCFAQLWSWP